MFNTLHTTNKNSFSLKFYFIFIYLLLFLAELKAQDRIEVGGRIGLAYYMGDLNPQQQFNNPGYQIGGIIRYTLNDRFAIKGTASLAKLNFSYPQNGILFPEGEVTYYEDRRLGDITGELEINFLSYDHPFIKKTRFTPYLSFGLGTTMYKRFYTETENNSEEMVFILSLPIGIGLKYKVNDWIRVGAEWTFRKTFVDDLDYASHYTLIRPDDPYGFGNTGSINNKDIYSYAGVMLTFSMFKRKTECKSGY